MLARKQVGDRVLNGIGILVLVDAYLAKALLVAIEHLRVLGEELEQFGE